jgi:hypothetical protein
VSVLSGLVAAFLAALAPAAPGHASVPAARAVAQAAHIQVLRPASAVADRRTRTCNARSAVQQSNRVEKELAPVACEQPPRSKVILTIDGGLFGSGR